MKNDNLEIELDDLIDLQNLKDLSEPEKKSLFEQAVSHKDLDLFVLLFENDPSYKSSDFYKKYKDTILNAVTSRSKVDFSQLIKHISNNPEALNFSDDNGDTLLHLAIKNHKNKLIEFIVAQPSILNLPNRQGKRPTDLLYSNKLYKEVQNNYLETLLKTIRENSEKKLIVQLSTSISSKNKKETLSFLLQGAGSEKTLNALVRISHSKRIEIDKDAVEFHLLYIPQSVEALDDGDNTAFHNAAMAGNSNFFEVAFNLKNKVMVGKIIDLIFNQKNKEGLTVFHLALKQEGDFLSKLISLLNVEVVKDRLIDFDFIDGLEPTELKKLIGCLDDDLSQEIIQSYLTKKHGLPNLGKYYLLFHAAILKNDRDLISVINGRFPFVSQEKDSHGRTANELAKHLDIDLFIEKYQDKNEEITIVPVEDKNKSENIILLSEDDSNGDDKKFDFDIKVSFPAHFFKTEFCHAQFDTAEGILEEMSLMNDCSGSDDVAENNNPSFEIIELANQGLEENPEAVNEQPDPAEDNNPELQQLVQFNAHLQLQLVETIQALRGLRERCQRGGAIIGTTAFLAVFFGGAIYFLYFLSTGVIVQFRLNLASDEANSFCSWNGGHLEAYYPSTSWSYFKASEYPDVICTDNFMWFYIDRGLYHQGEIQTITYSVFGGNGVLQGVFELEMKNHIFQFSGVQLNVSRIMNENNYKLSIELTKDSRNDYDVTVNSQLLEPEVSSDSNKLKEKDALVNNHISDSPQRSITSYMQRGLLAVGSALVAPLSTGLLPAESISTFSDGNTESLGSTGSSLLSPFEVSGTAVVVGAGLALVVAGSLLAGVIYAAKKRNPSESSHSNGTFLSALKGMFGFRQDSAGAEEAQISNQPTF